MLKLSAFLLAACAALPVHANWQLDNESSRLSFISTKATNITEVNRFRGLRGSVEDDGKVRLQVELETVETGIPLRDERLRKQLFEIARFAEAEISAQLDFAPLVALAPGALAVPPHARRRSAVDRSGGARPVPPALSGCG